MYVGSEEVRTECSVGSTGNMKGAREAVADALLQNLKEGLRDWVCWENKRQRSKPMTRLPYLLSSELFILKERQILNL